MLGEEGSRERGENGAGDGGETVSCLHQQRAEGGVASEEGGGERLGRVYQGERREVLGEE